MTDPNLYDLIRDALNDWGEYNQAMSPVRQAEIIQRLDNTFHKLRDLDLVWDIAEQKLHARPTMVVFDDTLTEAEFAEAVDKWRADHGEPCWARFVAPHATHTCGLTCGHDGDHLDNTVAGGWSWPQLID